MTLTEIIADSLNPKSEEQGAITRRKISFDDSHCRFEYDVSFGPDMSTPVYRHIYEADLRNFDPKRIEYRRSSSGPELILWTRFMRNVVEYETWQREKGRVKSDKKDSLWIPLKSALSPEQKREVKRLAESFMSGGSATRYSVSELQQKLDELDRAIRELTNELDFASHTGKGVLEQQIGLSPDRTYLLFQQFRKADVESDGARLSAKIPLWTIKEEVYSSRGREDSEEGLPRVGVHARDHRKPFKFEFSGPPAFTHKNTGENIYCQTGDDCDRLKELLEEAIVTAKELAFQKNSEQGASPNH